MISPGSLYVSENDNLGGVHFPSRDKMWMAELPPFRIFQTTLATFRGAGQPFVLTDWFGSTAREFDPVPSGFPIRFLGVDGSGNPAVVRCQLSQYSSANEAFASGWSGGPDQAIAAGTRIDNYPDSWVNSSLTPANRILAPNLVVNGKSTRWPAGLKPGQSFPSLSWFFGDGICAGRSGTHHWRAYGTGKITLRTTVWGVGDADYTITITNGVASPATFDLPLDAFAANWGILESDPTNPLHTPRLIPAADVAAFDAHEAAHPNDHYFTIVDPDHIADHGPGLVSRYIDGPLSVNHVPTREWTPEIEEWHRKLVLLCNASKTAPWISTPANGSDAYVTAKAQFYLDNLDPDVPVSDEHSNEVWNSFFQQANLAMNRGALEFCDLRVMSLTYDGTKVTATTQGDHPFQTAQQVVVEGSSPDKAYNGLVTITRTGARTFTYVPLSAPTSSPATTRPNNRMIAFRPTQADVTTFTSAVWHQDIGEIDLVPSANHPYAGQERIYLTGFDDPAFNGCYRIDTYPTGPGGTADPTRLRLVYPSQGGGSAMPVVTPGSGFNQNLSIGPAAGQTLRGFRIGGWNPNPSNPYWIVNGDSAQLWHGRRSAQIHKILCDKFSATPERVIRILGGFALSDNAVAMDQYNRDESTLGIPTASPKVVVIAPYISSQEDETVWSRYISGDVFEVDAGSISVSGGVATVSSATYYDPRYGDGPNHRVTNGSQWTVVNIVDGRFCGPTTLTVLSPTSFSFPVTGIPDGTFATVKQNQSRMRFRPTSAQGREIITVLKTGSTTARLTVPRHGFSVGDRFDIRSFNPLRYNGIYAIASVIDGDNVTITVPDLTGSIEDAGDRRCWMTPEALVLELVDVHARAVPSGKVEGPIQLAAAAGPPRGFWVGCYEFATHLIPRPEYGELEPVNYALQAANAHPLMEDVFYEAYFSMYRHGFWFCANYGRVGKWQKDGYWAFKNYVAQLSPRWKAVLRAIADFGRKKVTPEFDLEPRDSKVDTPRTITATGIGTTWTNGQTVQSSGGTVTNVVVNSPTSLTFRYRAGPDVGPDTITIAGESRVIGVAPAGVRKIYLHPPFLEANKPTVVEIVGFGTSWDAQTQFEFDPDDSTTTAVISNLIVTGAGHATATITTAGTGILSLSDTTISYPVEVVPQGTTPTAPRLYLDDSQAGNGSVDKVGNWDGWNADGFLGGWSYREGRNQSVPAWFEYRFVAPEDGRYEVAPSWVGAGNRATDAKYSVWINDSDATDYIVDQTAHSVGAWPAGNVYFQPIGTVDVLAGDRITVRLSGYSNVYNVIADGVMVRKLGESPTQTPTFGLSAAGGTLALVRDSSATKTIAVASVAGFGDPVDLSVSGLPTGVTASFSPDPITPPGSSVLTLSASGSATLGNATLTITGTSGGDNKSITIPISVSATVDNFVPGTVGGITKTRTQVNFTIVGTTATSPAASVQRQIKRSADSSWTNVGAANSTTPAAGLTAGTSYDLRALVTPPGGSAIATPVVSTTTPTNGPKVLVALR